MALAKSDLIVRIGGNVKGFQQAAGRAQGIMSRLSGAARRMSGILGIATAGGLFLGLRRTLNMMDRIAKSADRLGVTTEALVSLQHAAELTGAGADTLSAGLATMSKRLGEAERGTGAATAALGELNLQAADLIRLDADAQFRAIAKALEDIESPAKRNAIAANLFSKANMSLVNTLDLGEAGLREMRMEAERLGLTFDRETARAAERANDAISRLGASVRGVAIDLAALAAPGTEVAADAIGFLTRAVNTGSVKIVEAMRAIAIHGQETFGDDRQAVIDSFTDSINRLNGTAPDLERLRRAGQNLQIGPDIAQVAADARRVEQIVMQTESAVERFDRVAAELRRLKEIGAFDIPGGEAAFVRAMSEAAAELGKSMAPATEAADAVQALQEEYDLLAGKTTAAAIALMRLREAEGFTEALGAKFEDLQAKIERTTKAAEITRAAKALTERFLTPIERARMEMEEVRRLFRESAGEVSEQTAGRALRDIRLRLARPAAAGLGGPVAAARRGSREAFAQIAAQLRASREANANKEIAKNTRRAADFAHESNLLLRDIRDAEADIVDIPGP